MKIRTFLFVCLFCFLLPGMGSAQGGVKVGVILPLTGPLAEYGIAIKTGIEMAREDRPELFRALDFVYEDDQYNGQLALTAWQKLRAENVQLFFAFGSIAGHALGPLAEKSKLLLINFGFEPDPALGKSYVIRSINYSAQYIGALLGFLRARGLKSFTLINTELSFLNSMVLPFKSGMHAGETCSVATTVNPGDMDFRALITKLKAAHEPALGLFLLPDQLQAFFKQAEEQHYSFFAYGTDFFETSAIIAPGAIDKAVYPDNEVSAEFRRRFHAKASNEAHITFGGDAYDVALVVAEAAAGSETQAPAAFLRKFSEVRNRSGVLGAFSFAENSAGGRYFEFPVVIKEINGARGFVLQQ